MSYVPQKQLRSAVILFVCLFIVSVIAAFSLAGCAARVTHVTDLPAGVTEQEAKNWDAAVAGLHKVADLNTAVRKAVITARNAGAFPNDAAYATVLTTVGHVAQYEKESSDYLKQQPKTFGEPQRQKMKSEFQLIGGELQTLTSIGALPGIKNPDTQSTVQQIIVEIITTLNLILSF
jgi:hypothetical protein